MPSSRKSLWRNTPFQLMWTSAAASGFGDRVMMSVALALVGAWGKGTDTTAATMANSFFFLPYILLSVPAGWLADKLPRRLILMGCDFGRAAVLIKGALMVSAIALVAVPLVGPGEQWKVYASLLAVGSLAAIFCPARYAMIPQLVGYERVQMGNAVIGGIAMIAAMLGQVICGYWIQVKDPHTITQALWAAAVLYTLAGIAFACMRVPRHAHELALTAGGKKASGLRYILTHKRTMNLNLMYLAVWAMAMLVLAAVPAVGKMNFHLLDQELQEKTATLSTFTGAGLFLGAMAMSFLPTRRQGGVLMMLALIPTGLAMVVLVASPWMWLCYAACLACGFFGYVSLTACVTLIQSTTPDYVLGRVMGINSMLSTVGMVGISFIVGFSEIAQQAKNLGLNIDASAIPAADSWMLGATWIAGLALALMGAYYAYAHITRGVMPSRIANIFNRVNNFFCVGFHRTVWINRQRVPARGAAILCMNHTAGLDPWLVQAGLNRMIRWLMLDKYMFKVLKPLWDAVDPIVLHKGERGSAQIRQMITALEAGGLIGIFPEGGLQRSHRTLQPFKIGVAVLAKKTGVPVVPVWIHGTPLSENLAWQMLVPARCTVVFGEPIRCGAEEHEDEFLIRLRLVMLGLRAQVPADRRYYEEPDPEDVVKMKAVEIKG